MDPSVTSYLFALAGLSVTFAGFSTIAIAFTQATGAKMAGVHFDLVRVLVVNGLAAAAFSMLPPLLSLLTLSEVTLWRLCSAVLAIYLLGFFVIAVQGYNRNVGWPPPPQVFAGYSATITILALLCLNAAGIFFDPNAGLYALGATWLLAVSGLSFIMNLSLFLQRPGGPK